MHPSTPVIVLCPMAVEARAVERELRRAGLVPNRARVVQTGIGKEAILAATCRALDAPPPPGAVILAGACGGLRPVEDVPPIARVIDEHGSEWTGGVGFVPTGRTLVAVDRIIATPAEKRRLADVSGAAIVDMESHAFAAECARRPGLAWSIVRGVSDSPDESLPPEVLGWISASGDTRPGRAVLDMIRRPALIPHMTAVLRRSSRVLPMVGRRVAQIIASLDRGAGG